MAFASACRPSGDVPSSAGVARRGGSSSPSSSRASTPAPERFGFPRSHRLTRRAELDAVARGGKRIRTRHLEVRTIASLLRHPRVGLIVPKYRQTGVARNQLKRRLREIARTELLPVLPPVDLVVRTRPEAYRASFAELKAELERAAAQVVATRAAAARDDRAGA